MFFRVLFVSEGKVGHEIIRWIGAAYTVMGRLYSSDVLS